jgi:protein TonB
MGKEAQLNSIEWTDLIFEGKNHEYGAYELRRNGWKAHRTAFIAVFIFVIVVWMFPLLVDAIESVAKERFGAIETTVELTDVTEQKIPDEVKIKQETEAPPPPPLKTTMQFTPPEITDDDLVNDENTMKSQEKLIESKVQISIANIEGVDDPDAIDIADLEAHKVVVQDEAPFMAVEQMPDFPGGQKALMEYLAKHTNYPPIAAENNIQGRVTVRFVVTAKGTIERVEILQGIDRSCDEEALRVVRTMPKWIPGEHNGRKVPVVYTVPIVFKLQ